MLVDIIEVKVLNNYKLFLLFDNGVSGEIDLTKFITFEGIFAKLKNKNYFKTVHVDKELGTICWQNGADISPEFLYEHIHG